MTVILKSTGQPAEYNDEYAMRLLEQGQARMVTEADKPKKPRTSGDILLRRGKKKE